MALFLCKNIAETKFSQLRLGIRYAALMGAYLYEVFAKHLTSGKRSGRLLNQILSSDNSILLGCLKSTKISQKIFPKVIKNIKAELFHSQQNQMHNVTFSCLYFETQFFSTCFLFIDVQHLRFQIFCKKSTS